MSAADVRVIGAGLAGALMAVYLARRGLDVAVYEKRPDLRAAELPAGRSINLALANRGLRALAAVGLEGEVRGLLTTMRGRMIHDERGDTQLQPYGQRPWEVIYSVSRPGLNALLLDAAESAGARLHFERPCYGVDLDRDRLRLGGGDTLALGPAIAADGAGSVVREALMALPGARETVDWLPHDYKELTISAAADGAHRMEPHALHIWPRGGFMLIALPNLDGSFTVTLFLPRSGEPGFERLVSPAAVRAFFERRFPDATALMPDLEREFFEHPTSPLATVRCRPWHHGDRVCLIGDAAHAIVPFHGQGMNAAFEDCAELDACLEAAAGNWGAAFARFSERRKPDAEAIADMALENYVEMRDSVRDPVFQLRKRLAFELERRHPDRFVPRYSMVMFRDDIGYAEAQRRGRIQAEILDELVAEGVEPGPEALDAAGETIRARLSPLPAPPPG